MRTITTPKPAALTNILNETAKLPEFRRTRTRTRALAALTLDVLIQMVLDLNERSDDFELLSKHQGYANLG